MRQLFPWRLFFSISAAAVVATFFVNCDKAQMSMAGGTSPLGVMGAAEVVDTEDIDGEEVTDGNSDQIEEDLNDRGDNGNTVVVEADCNEQHGHKVLICHVPSGNLEAAHSICIAVSALEAHRANHEADGTTDFIGSCEAGPTEVVAN